MVTLNRSLVLLNVVSLLGLAVVGTRNVGCAMPFAPTPDHPLVGDRVPEVAGRPQSRASAPGGSEIGWERLTSV